MTTCTLCGEPADYECSVPKCKAHLCDIHAKDFVKLTPAKNLVASTVCPLHFAVLTAVQGAAEKGRAKE